MFVFNFNVFTPILAMKNEKQIAAFILLCGFNVLAATAVVLLLHPHMKDSPAALAFCGLLAGAAIFAISALPFSKK